MYEVPSEGQTGQWRWSLYCHDNRTIDKHNSPARHLAPAAVPALCVFVTKHTRSWQRLFGSSPWKRLIKNISLHSSSSLCSSCDTLMNGIAHIAFSQLQCSQHAVINRLINCLLTWAAEPDRLDWRCWYNVPAAYAGGWLPRAWEETRGASARGVPPDYETRLCNV